MEGEPANRSVRDDGDDIPVQARASTPSKEVAQRRIREIPLEFGLGIPQPGGHAVVLVKDLRRITLFRERAYHLLDEPLNSSGPFRRLRSQYEDSFLHERFARTQP